LEKVQVPTVFSNPFSYLKITQYAGLFLKEDHNSTQWKKKKGTKRDNVSIHFKDAFFGLCMRTIMPTAPTYI